MQIQGIYRGRTYKEVTVTLASDRPVSDDLIAGFAMAKAGETPSTIFDWEVTRPGQYPLMAVVTLKTD